MPHFLSASERITVKSHDIDSETIQDYADISIFS